MRAEHEQAVRAVRDVLQRVRMVISDAAEKVKEAKVREKDAEKEVKEVIEWMKKAEGRGGDYENVVRVECRYDSRILYFFWHTAELSV